MTHLFPKYRHLAIRDFLADYRRWELAHFLPGYRVWPQPSTNSSKYIQVTSAHNISTSCKTRKIYL